MKNWATPWDRLGDPLGQIGGNLGHGAEVVLQLDRREGDVESIDVPDSDAIDGDRSGEVAVHRPEPPGFAPEGLPTGVRGEPVVSEAIRPCQEALEPVGSREAVSDFLRGGRRGDLLTKHEMAERQPQRLAERIVGPNRVVAGGQTRGYEPGRGRDLEVA
jgi:hypothetical protein